MEIIMSVLGFALTNNVVLSLVKYLSVVKETNLFLRSALLIVSALGIIATSSLSGAPVDFNSLTDIGYLLVQSIGLAIISHVSYKIIKS